MMTVNLLPSKDGLTTWCVGCFALAGRQRYAAYLEKHHG